MAEKTKQGEETGFTVEKVDPKKVKKMAEEMSSHPPRIFPMNETGIKTPQPRLFKKACRVCGGDVTEKIVSEYDPMSGPPIFGPGSRQQYHYVNKGLYCKQCGVKYEFVPGVKS